MTEAVSAVPDLPTFPTSTSAVVKRSALHKNVEPVVDDDADAEAEAISELSPSAPDVAQKGIYRHASIEREDGTGSETLNSALRLPSSSLRQKGGRKITFEDEDTFGEDQPRRKVVVSDDPDVQALSPVAGSPLLTLPRMRPTMSDRTNKEGASSMVATPSAITDRALERSSALLAQLMTLDLPDLERDSTDDEEDLEMARMSSTTSHVTTITQGFMHSRGEGAMTHMASTMSLALEQNEVPFELIEVLMDMWTKINETEEAFMDTGVDGEGGDLVPIGLASEISSLQRAMRMMTSTMSAVPSGSPASASPRVGEAPTDIFAGTPHHNLVDKLMTLNVEGGDAEEEPMSAVDSSLSTRTTFRRRKQAMCRVPLELIKVLASFWTHIRNKEQPPSSPGLGAPADEAIGVRKSSKLAVVTSMCSTKSSAGSARSSHESYDSPSRPPGDSEQVVLPAATSPHSRGDGAIPLLSPRTLRRQMFGEDVPEETSPSTMRTEVFDGEAPQELVRMRSPKGDAEERESNTGFATSPMTPVPDTSEGPEQPAVVSVDVADINVSGLPVVSVPPLPVSAAAAAARADSAPGVDASLDAQARVPMADIETAAKQAEQPQQPAAVLNTNRALTSSSAPALASLGSHVTSASAEDPKAVSPSKSTPGVPVGHVPGLRPMTSAAPPYVQHARGTAVPEDVDLISGPSSVSALPGGSDVQGRSRSSWQNSPAQLQSNWRLTGSVSRQASAPIRTRAHTAMPGRSEGQLHYVNFPQRWMRRPSIEGVNTAPCTPPVQQPGGLGSDSREIFRPADQYRSRDATPSGMSGRNLGRLMPVGSSPASGLYPQGLISEPIARHTPREGHPYHGMLHRGEPLSARHHRPGGAGIGSGPGSQGSPASAFRQVSAPLIKQDGSFVPQPTVGNLCGRNSTSGIPSSRPSSALGVSSRAQWGVPQDEISHSGQAPASARSSRATSQRKVMRKVAVTTIYTFLSDY